MTTAGPPVVAACWKRVEARAAVDPLTGAVRPDPLSAGPSAADEAALEWALRVADAWGWSVVAVTAGGAEAGEMLRGAIAAGASRGVVVPLDDAASSETVAAALAAVPAVAAAALVCCGDASLDRGSGAVPAFLAAELSAAQALGLVHLEIRDEPDPVLVAERRLDRGRRERLRVGAGPGRPPAVVSVEAASARLRRATLDGVLAARNAPIEVVGIPSGSVAVGTAIRLTGIAPFRPRAHVVPPPPPGLSQRERILLLTGALSERTGPRTLRLDPDAAAEAALAALGEWGELPDGLEWPHDPAPGGDEPGGDEPGGDRPGGREPGGDEPGGDEPGGDRPGGDQPGGDQPGEAGALG